MTKIEHSEHYGLGLPRTIGNITSQKLTSYE